MASPAQPSPAQAVPFFGRAWSIGIDTADGSHYVVRSSVGKGEDPLRVRFSVNTFMLLAYWTADVTIYNMRSDVAQSIISQGSIDLQNFWKYNQNVQLGDSLTLSAGYSGDSGTTFDADANLLFSGQVIQPVWTRERVVDFCLTLRCVTGLLQDAFNYASFPLSKGATAYDTVTKLCNQCSISQENIDPASKAALTQSKAPRGQVVFGRPYETIRQIAKQNNLSAWISPNGLNIRSFDPKKPPPDPDYAYGPANLSGAYTTSGTQQGIVKNTLLGTPEQTQNGVIFRVELDSSVKIGDTVQLAPGTLISPFPVQIAALPAVPSRNGIYVVAGVKHSGDSRGRGDDWVTEITGVTMDFFADFLQAHNG